MRCAGISVAEPAPATLWSALPALLVETDPVGRLVALHGEWVKRLPPDVGGLDDIGRLFTRPAAIFLETHLWPLLRREGRFDECHIALRLDDDSALPCFASARWFSEGESRRVAWLFTPATQRARFEAELIEARAAAQRLARELAEANQRLEAQAEAEREHSRALGALAQTDPLTGLGNRRALQAAFEESLRCRDAEATPDRGALLMVDADHFKAVNDRWGHAVGDGVLVRLAQKLQASIRRSDCVVRLGGEEFALWLPGASEEVAHRVADEIHRRMADLQPDGSDATPITVSIGVALLADHGDPGDLAALLKRADGALYTAKRRGRNRTCRAGDPAD